MTKLNSRGTVVLVLLTGLLSSGVTAVRAQSPVSQKPLPGQAQRQQEQTQVDGIVSGVVDTLWLQTDYYWHHGDYPRIVALDRIITEADPQFLEAYATGGWLIDSLGHTAEAEAYYTLGTRNNPQSEFAFFTLGMFEFTTKKDYPAAARAFQSAVAQPNADIHDWKMLGHSLEKAGQWDAAVAAWKQTKARYPNGLLVDHLLADAEEKRRQAQTGEAKPNP